MNEFERSRVYYRDSADLVLTRREREEILAEWGVPFEEIIQAIRANVKVKYQRRRTVIDYDKWEEALEVAGRKIKHVLLPKKSRHDQLLWDTTRQHVPSSSLQKASPAQSIKCDEPLPTRKAGSVGPGKGSRGDFSGETRASDRVKKLSVNETTPTRHRRLSDGDLQKDTKPLLTLTQRKAEQYEEHHTTEGRSPHQIPKQQESLSYQMSFDSDTASLSTHPSEAGSHSHRPLVVEFDRAIDDSIANCSCFASEAHQDYGSDSDYDSGEEEDASSAYSNWTRSTAVSADGNFDGLIRGSPHHFGALQPGCCCNDEGPRIQRLQTPVVICEDDGFDDEIYMMAGDFCSLSSSVAQSSYGRPPLPPSSSRAPPSRRAYVVTPVAYAQQPQQDPLPSTAYNVVNGRYNDAPIECKSPSFGYREHDQYGFSTLAPPNSSNWKWE